MLCFALVRAVPDPVGVRIHSLHKWMFLQWRSTELWFFIYILWPMFWRLEVFCFNCAILVGIRILVLSSGSESHSLHVDRIPKKSKCSLILWWNSWTAVLVEVTEHKLEFSQTRVFVWFSTLIFLFYKILFIYWFEFSGFADFLVRIFKTRRRVCFF